MPDILKEAHELRERREPFALATVVACRRPTSAYPGARAIVRPYGKVTGWVGGSCAQPIVVREALKALRDGRPRLLTGLRVRDHLLAPRWGFGISP